MKLTILETGAPPEAIAADFDRYPQMFERLISPLAPDIRFDAVSVYRGEALPDPATLDAALITGSPAGVYDELPWIGALLDFIRGAAAVNTPLIGVCFGHQAIAQALGGKVEKSHKGWGIGRHTYDVLACPEWAGDACGAQWRAAVSHQDQVTQKPPGAETLARSRFTEFAALHYPHAPALSFQCHPEFDDAYAGALYAARRDRLGAAETDAALQSLAEPADASRLARLMVDFLRAHA